MAQFRRSKRFGPFRITATTSGFTFSSGVKGFRLSANTRGQLNRTISIPGTGIYDRQQIGSLSSILGTTTPTRRSAARPAPTRTDGGATADDDSITGTELNLEYADGTGRSRDLPDSDPTVATFKVVEVPGGTGSIADLAAAAAVTTTVDGWTRGIRDGFVVDRGSRIDVVLMITPGDNPAIFSRRELAAGTPKGVMVGRLSRRDEPRWRRLDAPVDTVRVGIYLDATPGVSPVLQVRLRPGLVHHDRADEAPAPLAPAGWLPDPHHRFEHRWWDGSAWTDRVASNGVESTDPQ